MKMTTVSRDWQQDRAAGGGSLAGEPVQEDRPASYAGEVSIACYENQIPPFTDIAMDRLYGSLFSSMKHFRVYGSVDGATHTYVVRDGLKVQTIFLFRREGEKVLVLNEGISVGEEQVERFARYIFARYRSAQVICFKAVRAEVQRIPFPFQRHNAMEDIVVMLPPTPEQYHASLGKNTRRNIKRYGERLRSAFPSFTFEVFETSEIDPADVLAIIELNRARMAGKNKTSAIDEEESRRIVRLAMKCGLIGVCRIDGKVVAGGISFHIGDHFYLTVIAHDPTYDDYWLGILCCYHTIGECIRRGGREFHFLWGRYDYKFTLLGVQRDLDNVTVYRSRVHLLLNAGAAAGNLANAWKRELHQWLHDAAHHDKGWPSRVVGLLMAVRAWARGAGKAGLQGALRNGGQ